MNPLFKHCAVGPDAPQALNDAHIAWWKSQVLGYCQDGSIGVKPNAWNEVFENTPDRVSWQTWNGDCPTTSGGPYLNHGTQAGGTVTREPYTVNNVYHAKKEDVCKGNPIYPVSGAKRQFESLGNWLAATPITLVYDTRSRLPANPPNTPFGVQPLRSFGSWESTVHKQLVFSASDPMVVQASRGAGEWVTFTRDAWGDYRPDGDIKDELKLVPAAGWRYVDAGRQAVETYDTAGKLVSVTDRTGGVVTYVYSDASTPTTVAPTAGLLIKMQDHNGRAVNLQYTASGVSSVLDPAGQETRFSYDTANNLKSITWADGSVRQFLYETASLPWALTGIVDENSIRYATFGYDAYGRAVSTEHAGGTNKFSLTYSQPPGRYIVDNYDFVNRIIWRHHYWGVPEDTVFTEPNGNTGSLAFQAVGGMPRLTTRSQPAGSGCAASTSAMTYDGNGNVLSADDFNGNRICYAYDNLNREIVRVEGLATSTACSSVTQANATLPVGSRKVGAQWHRDWQLDVQRVEPGALTNQVYNGQPDSLNGNAIASCAPATAVLPDGRPIAVMCKRVVRATTDTDGSHTIVNADVNFNQSVLLLHMDGTDGSRTFADSGGSPKTVSAVGDVKVSTAQSKFGGASAAFDGAGDFLTVPSSADWNFGHEDFTIEFWARLTSNASGWFIVRRNSDADYAPFGLLLAGGKLRTVMASSSGANYAIDTTGTATLTTGVWHHIALVRGGGSVRTYVDGVLDTSSVSSGELRVLNEPLVIGAADMAGHAPYLNGYIDDLRITKGLARYTDAFAPPSTALGGSPQSSVDSSVLDASAPDRVWSYTYNQYGQVLTAKGPRTDVNDTTTYEYYTDTTTDHTLGDLKKVTNAKGQATQFTLYNKTGQVLRMVDANSVSTDYTYDARQRLKSTSVAGQTTTYDYGPSGQLKRVTQADASYVEYSYDDAQRLIAVSDNLGNRMDYTLDNAGKRTAEKVKDPSGSLSRQVTRIMDALGRVQQVTGRE